MQVVTANAFKTGEVVYIAASGPDQLQWPDQFQWVDDLQRAQVFTDDVHVAEAIAAALPHQVVGAYVIDVDARDGTLTPLRYREVIRASGPTNYRHGKADEGVRGRVSL